MAGPTKCVLLVDYGSLHRSLTAVDEVAAAALAPRLGDWLAAIEAGELIEPAGELRAIALKRCYAEPGMIAQRSGAFAAAGFEMVDCGATDGDGRADLNIAVDAMEVANQADAGEEVILLTAAPGLGRLVQRLKARGRKVVVYAEKTSAAAYREAADGVLTAEALADLLMSTAAPPAKGKAIAIPERGRIEAFAREINAATNIPLFSPKTFAELFRLLCAEIATSGYHFQSTAKNVAGRLDDGGRSVTSRQVVFVVKGLALKGHVFSTSDTPERLAEVFREQARYLIASAGVTLDADRERLLAAWIAAPAAKAAPPKEAAAAPKAAPQTTAAPAAEAAKSMRKPAERKPAPPEKPVAAARPARPAAYAVKPPERPKSAALPPKPAPPQPPAAPKPPSPADVRAAISARIAASARIKPPARPAPPSPRPAPAKPAAVSAASQKSDAIESSILAAIAEAVDVLVEDRGKGTASPPPAAAEPPPAPPRPAPPPTRPAPAARAAAAPPPEPEPEPDEGGGDIGDEIQRIVATYNRNRKTEERR